MRKICYLHLTHFVRILLDRKDRMSMALGLEVRVPFCDHRLVEYVYNAPWSFKAFDGREKSLLRAATRDLLPQSVVDRVKSPYPSTQDPRYVANLQHNAREYLSDPGHPVFDLVNRTWLAEQREGRQHAARPGRPHGPGTHAGPGAVAGHVQAVAEVDVTRHNPAITTATPTGCSSTQLCQFWFCAVGAAPTGTSRTAETAKVAPADGEGEVEERTAWRWVAHRTC